MAGLPGAGAGLLHVFSLFLCCVCEASSAEIRTDPRSQFNDHAVIYPTLNPSTKDTEIGKGFRGEMLHLGFEAFNRSFMVELIMNKDLIPDHYFEKHHKNGQNVIDWPMKKDKNHCHYQGSLQGYAHSWVAVSTCNGISGVIYDGDELHYIEPDRGFSSGRHFLFKASDMKPHNFSCGVSNFNDITSASLIMDELERHRRSTVREEPYKSTSKSRYVELVIVNDNSEFRKFNRSKEIVFERSKQIANIVNGLYAPLNIFIALIGVIVWSEKDEIKLSTDGDTTLTNFLHYRQERLAQEHPNDNAQLITAMTFDGSVVGKALKGPICTYKYSGGVNMDHSDLVGLVATTLTHELGHNFGMEHDNDECKCPDDKCIMAPSSSSTSPKHWSSCSLEYLDIAYAHGMDYCLKNRPTNIIGPVCGNGFLEDGEQCDCGLKDFCDNHCCNASTCRLYSNASCAMGACCNMETCQVKKVATSCREAASECDLPEYCDGKSEFCPSDTYYQNGETCGSGKAFCYDGKCTSHADQCKLLWGESGKMAHIKCYDQNHIGNVSGNCGHNRLNQSYKICKKQDVLCGMLHCAHLSEKLEFGMESAATMVRSYVNVRGKVFTCRSAIVDLGLYNTDPGLVPNGAKCGDDKVCIDQKCILISDIKKADCSLQCNGNGVCNNRGHCHCSRGYNPPYCNSPGPGGSIDSGPAFDTGVDYIIVITMYVIFLGLIPLIVISAGLMYYFRPHFKTWWVTKARKANIKCRGNTPRKPHPPSKFNFDRNSLRTLEISAPIQQGITHSTMPISLSKEKTMNRICIPEPDQQSKLQNDRPIPVRPAPPRPVAVPQRTPSWTPATANMLKSVARSTSLRMKPNNNTDVGRPLSISSRPNCPPPRPPLPRPNFAYTGNSKESNVQASNDLECSTPNSMYYDDCQTLDFSDTPLAFVHHSETVNKQTGKNTSSQESSMFLDASEDDPVVLNQHKVVDKTNLYSKDITGSVPVVQCSSGRTRQPSLVASLAKRFENQNSNMKTTSSSQMRPPFKMRPLPPTPKNQEI